MLDHPDPELMIMAYSVSCDTPSLTTIKRVPLYERSARQAEYFNDVAVDPGGKLAVVSCYTGKLKLIILKDGNYESDFDVSYVLLPPYLLRSNICMFRISELTILALTFVLSAQSTQVLAILHFDRQERMQLISRDICLEALELSQSPSMILPNTVISAKTLPLGDTLPILIPIPPSSDNLLSPGGVLLIGGRKILFFELAPADWQEKHTGKERRLGIRMKSLDTSEVHQAKQKQLERQSKKRRPSATVEWPWSEVTA
jgi:DNA damage-binding protein 1